MADSIPVKSVRTLPGDSFLETRKNELLAAAYDGRAKKIRSLLDQTGRHFLPVLESGRLSETDEKILNQILRLVKKFENAIESFRPGQLPDAFTQLKDQMLEHVRRCEKHVFHISLADWERRVNLTGRQYHLLFKTLMSFQLTKGCSNFCRRCNEWALPKVRGHFTFETTISILDQVIETGNPEISLYGASDPLDYHDHNKTIADIISHLKAHRLEYSLLSKLPRGKTDLLSRLLKDNANISVSVTARNKRRIQTLEKKLGTSVAKQHDTDDLLIPACLDEDFRSVKPSITDGYGTEISPDGAFIIIPTFTSALHPFGHKKIEITPGTDFFPVKKTGRHSLLVDYFKPLECYDLNEHRFFPDRLFDVQVESILLDNGTDDLTPPGMRSTWEYFSIFEAKARSRRKKMTVSVMRKLKRQYLRSTAFENLPVEIRPIYLAKIQAHLDLCRKDRCHAAARDTASFLLNAIIEYCANNPTKKRIIKYLLETEIKDTPSDTFKDGPEINRAFLDDETDSFTVFRSLCLQIVSFKKVPPAVVQFVKNNPAVYDPVADIFRHPTNQT